MTGVLMRSGLARQIQARRAEAMIVSQNLAALIVNSCSLVVIACVPLVRRPTRKRELGRRGFGIPVERN
jgi:hypothetical protein